MSAGVNDDSIVSLHYIICECGHNFTFVKDLRAHLRKVHPEQLERKQFRCGECRQTFNQEHECISHYENAHITDELINGAETLGKPANSTAEPQFSGKTTSHNAQGEPNNAQTELHHVQVKVHNAQTEPDNALTVPYNPQTVPYIAQVEPNNGQILIHYAQIEPDNVEMEHDNVQTEPDNTLSLLDNAQTVPYSAQTEPYNAQTENNAQMENNAQTENDAQTDPDNDQTETHNAVTALNAQIGHVGTEKVVENKPTTEVVQKEKPVKKVIEIPQEFSEIVQMSAEGKLVFMKSKSKPKSGKPVKLPRQPKSTTCDICDKKFSTHAVMTQHRRVHTGERPFCCEYCRKTFNSAMLLTIHTRRHTGERPYKCELCPKTFPSGAALARHLRVHTGEKPYQCPTCDKKFSQSNSMKLHINTVHLKIPTPYKSKPRLMKEHLYEDSSRTRDFGAKTKRKPRNIADTPHSSNLKLEAVDPQHLETEVICSETNLDPETADDVIRRAAELMLQSGELEALAGGGRVAGLGGRRIRFDPETEAYYIYEDD